MNWHHPLASGLMGFWLLNEACGNVHEARSGLVGTMTGSENWMTGPSGMGISGSGYITNPYQANYSTTVCSCAALCRATGAGDSSIALASRNYNGSRVPFILSIWDGGAWGGMSFYDGTWHKSTPVTDIRGDGKDHLICGTYDGTTLRYYIDGRQDSSTAYTGSMDTANTNPLEIGRYINDSTAFTGIIYTVWFWNRALLPGEVLALSTNPYGMLRRTLKQWLDIPPAPGAAFMPPFTKLPGQAVNRASTY